MGIVIEPTWILTVIPYCEENCNVIKVEIIPWKSIAQNSNLSTVCQQAYSNDKSVWVRNDGAVNNSPKNSSLSLISIERFFFKSYVTKSALLSRGILLKLQTGHAINLVGISTTSGKAVSPMKYRYRVRSKIPPPNSSPPATIPDHCSQDLPVPCSWIPGSPIIYQPPRSTKYALLGLTSPQKICQVLEVYESHVSLSKDIEWIDKTVF
jgi:hypothetical protein